MELKEKIEKSALENGRTITAEAVYRLEQSYSNNTDVKNLLKSMPLEEFVQLVFEKTNSNTLSLTIEEIERGKKAP